MNTAPYAVDLLSGWHTHWGQTASVALDGTYDERTRLVSQIAQGTYFADLAQSLEQLRDSLPSEDAANRETLKRLIRELQYLQDRYEIL
jgi:hypothetical protein